ncbi:MAG: hypothetical protein H0T83_01810 [Chthoniobacterales bacterium]|nr:hypothetical protein [Chthoniobacterales bacterium]
MKNTFLIFFSAVALAATAFGQTPTPPGPDVPSASMTPDATAAAVATPALAASAAPTVTAAPIATITPTVAPSASPETEEDFDKAIERKIRDQFKGAIDGRDGSSHGDGMEWVAIPIVLIIFVTIFGLPVAIVGTILYFSFSKNRAMHKTVRMMVEKGQPVPEAILNPPPVVRQRSDLRRGITLLMVGASLMIFLGATNDWEGGAWSIGVIPFMIGLGYLLVWRLDIRTKDPSPKV